MHMIQDLSMPYHANDKTGEPHRSFEKRADELMSNFDGEFATILQEKVERVFGVESDPTSYATICNGYILNPGTLDGASQPFNYSLAEALDIYENAGNNINIKTAISNAVIGSMKLLTCLGKEDEIYEPSLFTPIITYMLF